MKLSQLVKIWEILHKQSTDDIGFCDLCDAMEEVTNIENDLVRY